MADPPETAPATEERAEHVEGRSDRKALLPILLIAAVVIVPVAVWALGSGGSDSLSVQQNTNYYTGGPEIVVGIPKKYNNMAETNNKTNVVVVCYKADGQLLFQTTADWPFINEPGYDLPHVHTPVTNAQLKAMATCTVRGMKHKLTGALRRTKQT